VLDGVTGEIGWPVHRGLVVSDSIQSNYKESFIEFVLGKDLRHQSFRPRHHLYHHLYMSRMGMGAIKLSR